jgi:hypothetical protein
MLSDSQLTPFSNWIFIAPLIGFTLIYMLKEGILDYRRKKNDSNINNRVWSEGNKHEEVI